jgi:hypothetical protein
MKNIKREFGLMAARKALVEEPTFLSEASKPAVSGVLVRHS